MKNDESDSRPVILIIDDEPDFLDSARLFLQGEGKSDYEILTASQLGKVAEIIAQKADRLHMILLDIHMPDCSGLDMLRWVRAHPQLTQVPILMLSADQVGRRRVAETKDPNLDFLLKPFDPEVLYYRVKRFGSAAVVNRS
ncbi:MAG: response regulator [Acidobacteriota bacterium]